jgi:hypothetical protein
LGVDGTANEIGRLASGNLASGMTSGTETIIHFIHVSQIPQGKKTTYLKVVVADTPKKAIKQRVRYTVDADKIEYAGDCSTKTADLTTEICVFNSILFTPGAKFMTMDIKDLYLNTPMAEYEYMRTPVQYIPTPIMQQYQLEDKIHKDHVYVEIRKGMYGLTHAGKIANDRLVQVQATHTHGLSTHKTRKGLIFSLIIDDFGVQYTNRADADHLATEQFLHHHHRLDRLNISRSHPRLGLQVTNL